ncbi:hypothetical protein UCRNP2_8858 [Neofusicoccum parvum UCRNP2]|uniref:Uncharacterized protein n=1 Tax=Botryosphaeria parva (strain UCR-NP2) TaxID=1287680 RepID=R1GEU0_BOTPV|nr:hypothetical protein UCRNP2_8858 [Neofusicoccum parvum UCRNP2]
MSSLQTTPSKRISSGVLLPYPRECLHLRIGLDMQTDYDNDPNASTATATPLLWLRLAIATTPAKGAAPRGTAELDEFIYLVMPANRFYGAAPGGKTGSLTLTRYADQPARWRVPAYVRDAMGASAARLCRGNMCVLELSLEFAEARKRKRAEEREKARAEKKAKVEKEARADSRAVAGVEKSEEMSKKRKVVEVFKKTNTEDMEITYD